MPIPGITPDQLSISQAAEFMYAYIPADSGRYPTSLILLTL